MLVIAMVQIEQNAAVVNCTRQTAMPGNEVRQTGTAPRQLSMDEVLLFRRGRASPRQCNQLGGVVELEAESLLFSKKVNRAPHLGFEPWSTTAGAMGRSHYATAALLKDVQFKLFILKIQCAEQIKEVEAKSID